MKGRLDIFAHLCLGAVTGYISYNLSKRIVQRTGNSDHFAPASLPFLLVPPIDTGLELGLPGYKQAKGAVANLMYRVLFDRTMPVVEPPAVLDTGYLRNELEDASAFYLGYSLAFIASFQAEEMEDMFRTLEECVSDKLHRDHDRLHGDQTSP